MSSQGHDKKLENEASIRDLESASQSGPNDQIQPKRSTLRSVLLVLTCTCAMIVNVASITAVSIAITSIARELLIAEDHVQWLLSAYSLSSGCLLLLLGRLADLYGRKKAFLLGSFVAASFALGCGFAQNEISMFILRAFQGAGVAATIPASLGILAHAFPPSTARSVAFATFSAGAPLGGAVGNVIGAIFTQYTERSWRSTFYMLAGLSSATIAGGFFAIDPDVPTPNVDKRVDWIGAFLVTSGLVLLTFVLGEGEIVGWKTGYIIALLILSVFLIAAFVGWQHYLTQKTTRPPLLRLALWTRANGKFAAMQSIAFLNWSCFTSWVLWATLYYQSYKHFSSIQTMLRFLPMTVAGVLCNAVVALFVGRIDGIWLVVIGLTATGSAPLLFALINTNVTYWAFGFPAAVLSVFGADFVFASGTLFVAKVALPGEQSVAGALFQTITQLGTAFGLAITTIVHNSTMRREAAKLGVVVNDLGTNSPPEAVLKGYRSAHWTSFAFAMLALLVAVVFLRGIGVVGTRSKKAPSVPDSGASDTKEADVKEKEATASQG